MNKRFLVLCAMEEERPVGAEYTPFHDTRTDISIYAGVSGVGKVNAALAVARWTNYCLQGYGGIVIVIGSAGSLDPSIRPGTFVISTDARQHDVDASPLGFPRGDVPFAGRQLFYATQFLVDQAEAAAKTHRLSYVKGRYLTGDRFIASQDESADLRERFGGACVDFETAAVAQACEVLNHSWVAIKYITDGANEQSPEDFQTNLIRYREGSDKVVRTMINQISAHVS